jgi:discoidin domain receptor family protein 2
MHQCYIIHFLYDFLEGVVSYSIPQGMVRGSTLELMDHTYDGKEDPRTGDLRGGLGQLVDGKYGVSRHSKAKALIKGYEWLGWKKKPVQQSLNLVFAFDAVRTFGRVDIHANNHFTKDIQVFKQARIYFSNEEDKFGDDAMVEFSYMPDLALENARNVSINLKGEHGKYVMLQLGTIHILLRHLNSTILNLTSYFFTKKCCCFFVKTK